jgi:prophage regulatory protein
MRLLRLPDACAVTGYRRSALYEQIKRGLIPRPVNITAKSVAWVEDELDAINRARVAGKSDDEIRALVVKLEERRKEAALGA